MRSTRPEDAAGDKIRLDCARKPSIGAAARHAGLVAVAALDHPGRNRRTTMTTTNSTTKFRMRRMAREPEAAIATPLQAPNSPLELGC